MPFKKIKGAQGQLFAEMPTALGLTSRPR